MLSRCCRVLPAQSRSKISNQFVILQTEYLQAQRFSAVPVFCMCELASPSQGEVSKGRKVIKFSPSQEEVSEGRRGRSPSQGEVSERRRGHPSLPIARGGVRRTERSSQPPLHKGRCPKDVGVIKFSTSQGEVSTGRRGHQNFPFTRAGVRRTEGLSPPFIYKDNGPGGQRGFLEIKKIRPMLVHRSVGR